MMSLALKMQPLKKDKKKKRAHQNLLIAIARRDCARVLQQAITQCAFPMVNVRHNAEVSISLNRDGGDASLELRGRRLGGCCIRAAEKKCVCGLAWQLPWSSPGSRSSPGPDHLNICEDVHWVGLTAD